MSDPGKRSWLKDSETLLRLFEICAIIATVVYVFAIQSQKVETLGANVERNSQRIETNMTRSDEIYVRKDVFNQQYNQIIYRLDDLTNEIKALIRENNQLREEGAE